MRTITIYECEQPGCKFSTKDYKEMRLHEANHLGINSLSVYAQYSDLQQKVRTASYTLMVTKNEETDAAYDNAIKKIMEFEKLYNIKGDKT